MKKLLATAGLGAALALGSLTGAATASATADPAVCNGIDEASSYRSYLISAWAVGQAFNYDPETQASNIAQSVLVYCPWHASGIRSAAASLS